MDPLSTCKILRQAAAHLRDDPGTGVVCDSGIENFNGEVDALLNEFSWKRIKALVDVTYSNSKIERWWQSLKHQWLYLNHLNTIDDARRLMAFYVTEHNGVIPHAAFDGQTPDEMFFGKGESIPGELKLQRLSARVRRLEANRLSQCAECPREFAQAQQIAA